MRLPKQALSYTSLVVAAKHSKDLSTTEDKFRERERTALYLRHAGVPGMEMLEKTGGGGWDSSPQSRRHHPLLPPPHSPFPKARPAPPERGPPSLFRWLLYLLNPNRGSSPLGQQANSMGGYPGMGGTWPCTSDPVVKLDCWPFTAPWVRKHQSSWMVTFHLESC